MAVAEDFAEKLRIDERNDWQRASELYKRGELADTADLFSQLLTRAADGAERADCHAAIAAVRLKQHRWREALESCTKALSLEPRHGKALFRKAQAHHALSDPQAASAALAKARKQATRAGNVGDFEGLARAIAKDLARAKADAHEAALARGLPIPRAPAEVAGSSRDLSSTCHATSDLSSTWRRELASYLCASKGAKCRMAIKEGGGHVGGHCALRELPIDLLELGASVRASPGGEGGGEGGGGKGGAVRASTDGSAALFSQMSITLWCYCHLVRVETARPAI